MSLGEGDAIPALQKLMLATQNQSPLHSSIVARVKRQPLDVARILAPRYPETPAISYIPALAWAVTSERAATGGPAFT